MPRLLLFLGLLHTFSAKEVWRQGNRYQVAVQEDGTYNVEVNGQIWLENKAYLTALHVYRGWCYGSDGLGLNNVTNSTGKEPILGPYDAVTANYHCPLDVDSVQATDTPLLLTVKYFKSVDLFVFETSFPEGGEDMALGQPGHQDISQTNLDEFSSSTNLSVQFPSFDFSPDSKLTSLGYVEWHGRFSADSNSVGVGLNNFKGGIEGGPLVLYDTKSAHSDAIVIGPFNNFKYLFAARVSLTWPKQQEALGFGLSGYVDSVEKPDVFTARFGLSGSMYGVTDAVEKWGSTLRTAHGTHRISRDFDPTNSKLGYWTDNGAYYYMGYWKKHPDEIPQDVLVQVKEALDEAQVPVAYMQLDPWWYPFENGCVEWTEQKNYFPKGLPWFREQLGIPLLLYAGYFSTANVYAANKSFEFLTSFPFNVGWARGPIADVVPAQSADFYDAIMSQHAESMGGFELDFTDFQFLLFTELQQSVSGSAEMWMKGIADAALKHNVSMQLCMELPNDLLQSVMFPAITNARASEDDFPTSSNRWNIAQTSLLMRALDIGPFFDDIWTTADQPGNPYGISSDNINLRTVISIFSAGPVGISDGRNMTNASLIRRTCRDDGVLLKPSKPAIPIDATYIPGAIKAGYIWSTYSEISSVVSYHVLAIDASFPYQLSTQDLYPLKRLPEPGKFVIGYWGYPGCTNGSKALLCVALFDSSKQFTIQTHPMQGKEHNFTVYSINPIFSNGWVLLGEVQKVVAVSPHRFTEIQESETGLKVVVQGKPREKLTVWFVKPSAGSLGTIFAVDVEIEDTGMASIIVAT
eukprot:m.25502 g.25502  ORF g.25502 m.25502 type:complete len:805 (+) comp28821_c0_seq1:115-2529(+)